MPTSGSVNYNITRDEIISLALQEVQALGAGQTAPAADVTYCSDLLNQEIKHLMTTHPHLWKLKLGFMFPEVNKFEYSLGNASTDDRVFNSYITTQLDGDLTAVATSVTLNDTTGMAANQIVGIYRNVGTIYWTTIASVTSSTVFVLSAATGVAIDDGNRVVVGTSPSSAGSVVRINRPLDIQFLWREHVNSDNTINRVPLQKISLQEYFSYYGGSITNSTPTQACYDKQNTSGILRISPTTSLNLIGNNLVVIGFRYASPLEDFDASTDNPDLPQEWLKRIILGLALRLATPYGLADNYYARLERRYEQAEAELLMHDAENDTLFIAPSEYEGYDY